MAEELSGLIESKFKAARVAMRNEMAQAKDASDLDKEGLALAEKMMENAFKKDAPVSEDMGKEIAGYVSKAASVKLRGASGKTDPTPALSGPSAGKGNTKTASNKAALDILTGKTSISETVVNKILTPGNLEGIRKANKEGLNLTEGQINEVIEDAQKKAEIAANDPATKEKFRQLGIDSDTFTSLTGNLTSGIANISASDIGAQVVSAQKTMSENQMAHLSNPFGSIKAKIDVPSLNVKVGDPLASGSDLLQKMRNKTGLTEEDLSIKNPFGSMGVDFGNIQGTIASLSKGFPPFKELDVNLPSVSGASNIAATGLSVDQIPDIVKKGGFTNLAETVKKSETLPDNIKPSTPVEEIGVPKNRPVTTLVYTTAHTAEEIELELGSTRREIGLIIVRWTGTTSDRRIESAKTYNEKVIEKKGKSANIHYLILRDGTVQRILNTEIAPEVAANTVSATGSQATSATAQFTQGLNNIYKGSIVICFDAGFICTEAEKNDKFLSSQSITSEQMESYRMIAEAAVRAYPGVGHIAMELLTETIARDLGFSIGTSSSTRLGPGFNADKFRENLMVGADTNEYVQERK